MDVNGLLRPSREEIPGSFRGFPGGASSVSAILLRSTERPRDYSLGSFPQSLPTRLTHHENPCSHPDVLPGPCSVSYFRLPEHGGAIVGHPGRCHGLGHYGSSAALATRYLPRS